VAYFVTQRTPELGLRIALGANPTQIVELILRQGMTLAIFGLMLGMGCAWWAGRLIESTLYGAGPPNVTVMAGVGLVLLATALLATLIPARRAAAVDPTSALRSE
jgi:ABC-type antimicrobial peptide transport system permease subunit